MIIKGLPWHLLHQGFSGEFFTVGFGWLSKGHVSEPNILMGCSKKLNRGQYSY
jgi:hypothetical protein